MNGIVYTTTNYSRSQKCNDNVLCVNIDDDIVFGAIIGFESNDNKVKAIIKIFNTTKLYDNFYSYNTTNNVLKVLLNDDIQKCQIFNINRIDYLSILHYYLLID